MNEISVLCLVGAHVDEVFRLHGPGARGLSVPSHRSRSVGGCALNVAAGLARLGAKAFHAGPRGADSDGESVRNALRTHGVDDLGVTVPDHATGLYAALVEPDGALALATAAMDIYARADALLDHAPFLRAASTADAMVLDANAEPGTLERLAACAGPRTRLVLLATSSGKLGNLALVMDRADAVFANGAEWALVTHAPRLAFVTDGAKGVGIYQAGVCVARVDAAGTVAGDVIGAGDAFAAGTLHAWLSGASPTDAARRGVEAAARCIAHRGALGWLSAGEGKPMSPRSELLSAPDASTREGGP